MTSVVSRSDFIQISGLRKQFGKVVALERIDLDIREGEFFSLLGPSGCGKTTLLRILSGLEFPTTGSVLIDGSDVSSEPPYRRPTNLVFQSYAIFPHLSVAENIAYGLRRLRIGTSEQARRVDEMLALIGLQGYGSRRPNQLSGGQLQRVALARALVLKPKVLLLDEPLAALDKKLRERMQLELRALQREVGITFVFVTHDQEEALTLSDRVAVMSQGRMVQCSPPLELYQRPKNRFVAEFVGEMNFFQLRRYFGPRAERMTVASTPSRSAAQAVKPLTADSARARERGPSPSARQAAIQARRSVCGVASTSRSASGPP